MGIVLSIGLWLRWAGGKQSFHYSISFCDGQESVISFPKLYGVYEKLTPRSFKDVDALRGMVKRVEVEPDFQTFFRSSNSHFILSLQTKEQVNIEELNDFLLSLPFQDSGVVNEVALQVNRMDRELKSLSIARDQMRREALELANGSQAKELRAYSPAKELWEMEQEIILLETKLSQAQTIEPLQGLYFVDHGNGSYAKRIAGFVLLWVGLALVMLVWFSVCYYLRLVKATIEADEDQPNLHLLSKNKQESKL